jgi:hypothetical protein
MLQIAGLHSFFLDRFLCSKAGQGGANADPVVAKDSRFSVFPLTC